MTDPSCRWCKGTGRVALAFSVVPCDECRKAAVLAAYRATFAGDARRLLTVLPIRDERCGGNGIDEVWCLWSPHPLPDRRSPTAGECGMPALGDPHQEDGRLRLVDCERYWWPEEKLALFFKLKWR